MVTLANSLHAAYVHSSEGEAVAERKRKDDTLLDEGKEQA